jgi:hypothetical protein
MTTLTDTFLICCYIAGLCVVGFVVTVVIAVISLCGLVVGWVCEVVK